MVSARRRARRRRLALVGIPAAPLTSERDPGVMAVRRKEMEVWDNQLGPLTREALMEAPDEASIGKMIAMAPMDCIDINTLQINDARMAAFVKSTVARRHGKSWERMLIKPRRS